MSNEDDVRVEVGKATYATPEREYFAGFTLNKTREFRVHDIVSAAKQKKREKFVLFFLFFALFDWRFCWGLGEIQGFSGPVGSRQDA
jgi:hypothetical protein